MDDIWLMRQGEARFPKSIGGLCQAAHDAIIVPKLRTIRKRYSLSSGVFNRKNRTNSGSVAKFYGRFAYCPDRGIAFAKSCRWGTLHDGVVAGTPAVLLYTLLANASTSNRSESSAIPNTCTGF
jgi:hypothetical protein